MTPLARTIAIVAALVALPAAAAAAAGPGRIRALPGQIGNRVRDIWEDDTVEGTLKRLAARLDDLTYRLEDIGHRETGRSPMPGRLVALAGIAVLVPASIAALVAPDRARAVRKGVDAWWAGEDAPEDGFDPEAELRGLSDRLETLSGDLRRQRESGFDAVTAAARQTD